jgi:hypothetical protein
MHHTKQPSAAHSTTSLGLIVGQPCNYHGWTSVFPTAIFGCCFLFRDQLQFERGELSIQLFNMLVTSDDGIIAIILIIA